MSIPIIFFAALVTSNPYSGITKDSGIAIFSCLVYENKQNVKMGVCVKATIEKAKKECEKAAKEFADKHSIKPEKCAQMRIDIYKKYLQPHHITFDHKDLNNPIVAGYLNGREVGE